MCNEVARRLALGLIRDDLSQLRIPLRFPEGLPNLQPLDSIRITDATLILRQASDGVEAVVRRWSWPGQGGRPVYNFRSEGRRFDAGQRCLIPVDGFYEFTDPPVDAPKRAKKTKWRFTVTGAEWFCVAGLWRRDPAVGEAFTLLTCEPGPDLAPYHSRQIVLPAREQWAGWLDGSLPAAAVCRPAPAGFLTVAPA
jgi:putative SOS response-associated peptidase YedK